LVARALCRFTSLVLCLTTTLATGCSIDASKLRARASDAQDGPVDYPGGLVDSPAVSETGSAGGGSDGDLASSDGAGGPAEAGVDGAGPQDSPVAVDENSGVSVEDAAGNPDIPLVGELGGARDVAVSGEPDTPMGQDGGAQSEASDAWGLGGASGVGGIGGSAARLVRPDPLQQLHRIVGRLVACYIVIHEARNLDT
jgi:hypothetical protein